jgi:HK97 family phage portal protein
MRWPWTKTALGDEVVWPTQTSVFDPSAQVNAAMTWAMQLGPEQVWNTQPYVRTVVTFLARNIAQLGLHVFERQSDTERERVTDDALARTLRHPNPSTTTYELIFGLVADKALYDRAYWLIGTGVDGAKTLTRLPPARVTAHVASDPLGAIETFRVEQVRGNPVDVPASRVLYFPGWNPSSAVGLPSSPIDAIKGVISEQAAAFEFRRLAWAHGLQASQVIERPAGVTWKPEQRDQFVEDVRAQFSGDGPRRNGVLLLEDGMSLKGEQFSAREAQWIDAAKLSLALVASVYHVNPTMVGLLDNANYSNVREFRKMLYGDTLGPIIASLEDRLNTFLVPLFGNDIEYVEFNIGEKLQGSFEEQAAAMQTAVGAPWMLRSEARALLNLPPIDGADELVVPLNLDTGAGPSSPSSAPPAEQASDPHAALAAAARPQLASVISLKAAVSEAQQQKVEDVLSAFFGKQQAVVLSRIGGGDDRLLGRAALGRLTGKRSERCCC